METTFGIQHTTSPGWKQKTNLYLRQYQENLDWNWNNLEIEDSLQQNGYKYDVKIPWNYSDDNRHPLFIFLHGGVDFGLETLPQKI